MKTNTITSNLPSHGPEITELTRRIYALWSTVVRPGFQDIQTVLFSFCEWAETQSKADLERQDGECSAFLRALITGAPAAVRSRVRAWFHEATPLRLTTHDNGHFASAKLARKGVWKYRETPAWHNLEGEKPKPSSKLIDPVERAKALLKDGAKLVGTGSKSGDVAQAMLAELFGEGLVTDTLVSAFAIRMRAKVTEFEKAVSNYQARVDRAAALHKEVAAEQQQQALH